jgi:dienelactone hydrolase
MLRTVPVVVMLAVVRAVAAPPETVNFDSADGKTRLIGYLFRPEGRGPHPAVVLLHGRAGAYSSLAKGVYDATTLTKRHKFWGEFWAGHGYVALLVDSFGPRGFWEGFGRGSYDQRPAEVSEQTIRPLDAYGALKYLRRRSDVIGDRIGLQGWSNGGMTTLVTMSSSAPGIKAPTPSTGFRAALAFYPGCGMEAIQGGYMPYAPLHMFVGTADEEVSPKRCQRWETEVRGRSELIDLTAYEGAEHNFDDPSASKQKSQANADATADARRRAEEFFGRYLRD